MNVTRENTDWGIVYHYKGDNYRFALYVYDDDMKTMYLSNVKVESDARKHGIGNKILATAESEAKKHQAETICLKVLKSSWVHNWYERHGYNDFCYDEDEKYVWMKHKLNKSNEY